MAMTYGAQAIGGRKCGVAVSALDEGGGAPFTPAMLRAGADRGLAWHSDWSSDYVQPGFTAQDYGEAKLVSQFWGKSGEDFEQVRAPLATVILGFNEPDRDDKGGSNLPVERALDLWMEQVPRARAKGYTEFVAPSISKALPARYTGLDGDPGSEWLPEFLKGCLARPGCPETITYLGFHLYEPNCITDVDLVRQWGMDIRVGSLKKLRNEFNGKGMSIRGLWLTEFGGRSGEEGRCRTLEQQLGWMQVIVPMLNAERDVMAYSWFSYGAGRSPFFHDAANLWDYATGELNALGDAYFTLCTGQAYTPPTTTGPAGVPMLRPQPSWALPAGQQAVPPMVPGTPSTPAQPASAGGSGWQSALPALLLCVLVFLLGACCCLTLLSWYRKRPREPGDLELPEPLLSAVEHFDVATERARAVVLHLWQEAEWPECSGGRAQCALCSDSGGEDAVAPEEREAFEALEEEQPQLVAAIASACAAAASDRWTFESKSESVFKALRDALLALPRPSALSGWWFAGGGGGEGERVLDAVPRSSKASVCTFLLRFDAREKSPRSRAQVNEICKRLECCPSWSQALRDAGLSDRRAALALRSV